MIKNGKVLRPFCIDNCQKVNKKESTWYGQVDTFYNILKHCLHLRTPPPRPVQLLADHQTEGQQTAVGRSNIDTSVQNVCTYFGKPGSWILWTIGLICT